MKRALTTAAALALSLAISGAAAAATSPAHHGTIHVFVTPSMGAGTGPIVITGAIGDYGTTQTINSQGKPDQNGNYGSVTLQQGSFRVNLTTLNNLSNKAQPTFNSSNCSFFQTVHGPIQLSNGAGAYAGITGTLQLTETFAAIGPKLSNGECNQSQSAQLKTAWIAVTGSGTVSW